MTRMREDGRGPETIFSYVSAEQRMPTDHPLRAIRTLVLLAARDCSYCLTESYQAALSASTRRSQTVRRFQLTMFWSTT